MTSSRNLAANRRATSAALQQYVATRGDEDLGIRAGDALLVNLATGRVALARSMQLFPGHLQSLIDSGLFAKEVTEGPSRAIRAPDETPGIRAAA